MNYCYAKGHTAPVTSSSQAGFLRLFCRRTGLSFTPREVRHSPFFRLFFFTLRQVVSELASESNALIPTASVLMIFFPSDHMLVRPVTTAIRKTSFKFITGNTRVMHMLRCLLAIRGACSRKVHVAYSYCTRYSIRGWGFTAAVRVVFFDIGGRLILDGSSVILYLIR